MAWLMLPFGVLLLLFIISPWTDRKGWTKVRGNAGRAAGASLERFNAFQLGHQAALEYRQEVHDEEDGEGGRPGHTRSAASARSAPCRSTSGTRAPSTTPG
jgi:hypothetical protein